jgi:hypothetical protein
MTKKKNPKLIVMFDTNALFTQVASDLVRHEVKRIVNANSNHNDLIIEWYIPEVVVGERKYQMIGKAKDLLPSMQKIEKLLGHKFGIGEDTIELHVDKAINDNIKDLGLKIATADTHQIDWDNLISRSVNRYPPFDASEKEKGFRDSIIAHSFLHLHKKSPSTPTVCLLALISDDRKLREYITELTIGSKNVRLLSNLDDLEGLINTLASTITEELATDLTQKASKIFFEVDNLKTFYFKESISEKIKEQYSKELKDTLVPGHARNNGTWWISSPVFMKKERSTIHWSTTVKVDFEIYHYEHKDPSPDSMLGLAEFAKSQPTNKGLMGTSALNALASLSQQKGYGLTVGGPALSREKILDFTGKEKFEVFWSTNLSPAQNLTKPKFEKIEYRGNDLAEGSS